MAEQTVEAGTVATIIVNVIDDNGDHVAATIDTTTTRLQKGDTSDTTWNSVVPTYDIIATGVYRIKFSSLSPAIVVDDNDELIRVKINGTISGTAWTEYHMPLKVLTAGGGGGGGGDATAANQTTIINHLTDVKGTSFVKDTHSLTDITADVTGLNGDVMRGTDGANTVAPDNTSIAAILVDTGTTIPNSISTLNDFDPALDTVANVTTVGSVTNPVTTDTASRDASKADVTGLSTFDASTDAVITDAASRTASQADVSALATAASIAALNDPSAATIADAVWDEAFSGHNVAGSFGKIVRQIYEGVVSQDGSVNDASATTTTFVTNLTQATDGFYHDKVIVFVSGSLAGQARHIETYTGSTKSITVSEAFTSAPANADEFLILATHEHSINEIQNGLATSSEIAALNDISTADVNSEILDVLTVDTFAEPSSVPAAATSLANKLSWVYTLNRNKLTQTSTTLTVRNDADGANVASAPVSDDGTTFTRGEYS